MKKLYILFICLIGFVWQMSAQSPLCESYPTTYCCEYVSSVTINGVTRAGAPDATGFASGPGYFDYTGEVLTAMVAGSTYPVSVTVKTNSSYEEFVKIWFDFNGNGNLSDAGELVFDQVNTFNGTYVYSGNITVPTTAFNGEVYIRVVMVYANSPALCGTYNYGTTLDFKASISGGINASNLTVATTASGGYNGNIVSSPAGINTASSMTTADFATGTSVTLTATANSGGTFISWSGDASGSSNPLTVTLNSDMNITANFGSLATSNPTSISATSSTICSGSSTQLTANGAQGTVYWYTASCGGTQVTTGNPVNVSPTTTTTYYARNYDNSQFSAGCASIIITVAAQPTAPSLTKNPNVADVCAGQSLTVSATSGTGGAGTITDQYSYSTNNASSWSDWSTSIPGFTAVTGTNLIRSRRTATVSGCVESSYNSVSWNVVAQPTSPGLTKVPTDAAVCVNQTLTVTATAGSGGIGTISDEYRFSTNNGTNWSSWSTSVPSFAAVSGTNLIQSRRTATGTGCNVSSFSEVSWSVYQSFAAGAIATTGETICSGTSAGTTISNTTSASGGNGSITYKWKANGNDIASSDAATYLPGVLTQTTTFTRWAKDGTCNIGFTQSTGNWIVTVNPLLQYRSKAGLDYTSPRNWTTAANWEQYNGSVWVAATSYPGQISNACNSPHVTIRASHLMEIQSGSTIDIPNLQIEATGKLNVKPGGKILVQNQLQLDENAGEAIIVGTITPPPFTCGTTQVTFTYNGSSVTYGTVAGQNNTCWLDRNLGASRVALSSTDYMAGGHFFQWGRDDDGHQLFSSSNTPTLATSDTPDHGNWITSSSSALYDWRNDNNNGRWNASPMVNNPCPTGWRVPTKTELQAEQLSWTGGYNSAGAFASPLKLPMTGWRSKNNGQIWSDYGYYWTSTVNGTSSKFLFFSSTGFYFDDDSRANGFTVRCIKE